MLPNAQDLKYFLELSESRNYSRAAERLGISQPSLSVAMQRLEQLFGVPLMHRSKRGAELTQAGRQLVPRAKRLLDSWEGIRSEVIASEQEMQGNYTIGCHVSVAAYSLPLFLPAMHAEFPKLEIRLVHDLSRKILEQVVRMEVDVGLVINPVPHPDLVLKKLASDEVTLWAPKKNKYKANSDVGGVLFCDLDLAQTKDLLAKMKRASMRFGRVVHSSSLEVIASLAASGSGAALLPARVAELNHASVLARVPGAPVFQDELYLVYRHENRSNKAMEMLVKQISAGFKH
jgi:DNA-binding transcriptional LysR family regulator